MSVADNSDPKTAELMYHCIGGGVPFQPPNTYALVYKSLPHHVARRLLALHQVLTETGPHETVYVRKQNNNLAQKLTLIDKEECTKELRIQVQAEKNKLLQERFKFDSCLEEYGFDSKKLKIEVER